MKPKRAKKGSVGKTLLLKLSEQLDKRARAAAEREGITLAEWWRRAGQAAVLRQEWERLETRRSKQEE